MEMMLILKRVDAALHIVIRLPSPLIIAHFMSIVQTKTIYVVLLKLKKKYFLTMDIFKLIILWLNVKQNLTGSR